MKRTSIAAGLYQSPDGAFWSRPNIQGRRTWRKLRSIRAKEAIIEANRQETRTVVPNFSALADAYLKAKCPNSRLESRPAAFCVAEKTRADLLKRFFGDRPADEIRLARLPAYQIWRQKNLLRGKGAGLRAVEKDWVTLSNILSYAVRTDALDQNLIRSARPRLCRSSEIRHCRDCAPASGDELNRIAAFLFANVRSEVLAWQLLMTAMTGCRASEIVQLRMDAATGQPGYVAGNCLFLKRSKGGVNPFAMVHQDLADVLAGHRAWYQERFPKNPWYFPGPNRRTPVHVTSLTHALYRACKALGLPHRTTHGLRSFYVTVRRSQGIPDVQIAAEIGDKTAALISQTYGDRPPNWTGGTALSWKPSSGVGAWMAWGARSPVCSPLVAFPGNSSRLPDSLDRSENQIVKG